MITAMSDAARVPENEDDRLLAVRQLCVLDTPPEPVFDHLTALACALFQVPMALVSIVDEHRQFFKSVVGLATTETPRSSSFCAYTILTKEPLVILDARLDPRFKANPLVTGHPHLRFYAGAPLRDQHGFMLGSFCVLSDTAREGFSSEDRSLLSRFAVLASDALEQRLHPARLHEAERVIAAINERYRLAARATKDGLWDWDLTTGRIYYSPRLRAMMGCPEEEHWAGIEEWVSRLHPEDAAAAKANVVRLTSSSVEFFENEYRMKHEDGTWRWVHNRGTAVRDNESRLLRLTGAMRDVTTERTRDRLTGLDTRVAFVNAVDQRLAVNADVGEPFAILSVGLDNFTRINDSLGSERGDDLLIEISHRLVQTLNGPQAGVVARLGGEEFALLVENIASVEVANEFAEKLLTNLHVAVSCKGQDIKLCASVGINLPQGHGSSTTQLLEDAQFAMHQAKGKGGGQTAHFDASMREKARHRLALENELRLALTNNDVSLFYQPKFDMLTGEIVGLEALMRWQHGEHGLISPATFIPLAEESDLILEIGRWTLRTAIHQLSLWRDSGIVGPNTTIAINLSSRQFKDEDLISTVCSNLRQHRVPAQCVDLEITEGVLIHDAPQALSILTALKAVGVGLDLDDFGTGFSSLSYLKRFPFDTLKIDRSFVMELGESKESLAIVQAILALGTALHLKVVAEGIETQAQSELLLQAGCKLGQGYMFCKPLSADAICAVLLAQIVAGAIG